jgi:SAM-dependent methyltransferase
MPILIREGQHYADVAKHFDSEYSRMKDIGRSVGEGFKLMFNRINDVSFRGGFALDIGCGIGTEAVFLAQTGKFTLVEGIDISEVAIAKASNEASIHGTNGKVSFKVKNALELDRPNNYSFVLMDSVLEYVSEDYKQLLMLKVMESTRPGGINMLTFVTSLPDNFLEERLGYWEKLKEQPFRTLFEASNETRAKSLPFESSLVDLYRNEGWKVVSRLDYDAERNFVPVKMTTLVVQKPEDEAWHMARRD